MESKNRSNLIMRMVRPEVCLYCVKISSNKQKISERNDFKDANKFWNNKN